MTEHQPTSTRYIRGTRGDDTLVGDDRNNVFIGRGGNDRIIMGGGADIVIHDVSTYGRRTIDSIAIEDFNPDDKDTIRLASITPEFLRQAGYRGSANIRYMTEFSRAGFGDSDSAEDVAAVLRAANVVLENHQDVIHRLSVRLDLELGPMAPILVIESKSR